MLGLIDKIKTTLLFFAFFLMLISKVEAVEGVNNIDQPFSFYVISNCSVSTDNGTTYSSFLSKDIIKTFDNYYTKENLSNFHLYYFNDSYYVLRNPKLAVTYYTNLTNDDLFVLRDNKEILDFLFYNFILRFLFY